MQPVPPRIETRPFTIHPELYAWPSFRIASERVIWVYLALLLAIGGLLSLGTTIGVAYAALTAVLLVVIAVGFSFVKHRTYLRRPANRSVFRDSVVSLSDDEVRQDFTDGSHMAIKLFAVKRFRELGDFYFAFATPRHFVVVPKTAFESPEQSREFAERLRQAARK